MQSLCIAVLLLNYLIEAKGGKVKEAGIPNSLSPKDQHLLNTKGPAPPGRKQTGTGTSGGSLAEVCCTFTFHSNWIIICSTSKHYLRREVKGAKERKLYPNLSVVIHTGSQNKLPFIMLPGL